MWGRLRRVIAALLWDCQRLIQRYSELADDLREAESLLDKIERLATRAALGDVDIDEVAREIDEAEEERKREFRCYKDQKERWVLAAEQDGERSLSAWLTKLADQREAQLQKKDGGEPKPAP